MIGESSIIVPSALLGTGKWRSSGREQAGVNTSAATPGT